MNNFSEIKKPMTNINPANNFNDRMKMEIPKTKKPNKYVGKILGIILVIIILGLIYFSGILKKSDFVKNSTEWQAVFLTSGETYFGKVVSQNKYEVVLQNIFYLQSREALQQGANVNRGGGDIPLIKLGNEIHGPADQMRINREQVLMIEDMKNDAKIMKAILEYVKK